MLHKYKATALVHEQIHFSCLMTFRSLPDILIVVLQMNVDILTRQLLKYRRSTQEKYERLNRYVSCPTAGSSLNT